MVKDFTDPEIYRMSVEIAKSVYSLSKDFPKDETYGMRDQIRRAVASIGANIAEGFGRFHYKDKLVFMYNSRGSIYETIHFLELAFQVGYISIEVRNKNIHDLRVLAVKLSNFISSIGKIVTT